jgi:hypothetical protein
MSAGHGAKLGRQREIALAALLTAPTITEAAKVAGLGESTLRRWLSEPAFQAAYREAREEAVRMAVGRLQGLLAKATETLDRTMACGTAGIELRAAVAVFELAYKGGEVIDLAERVAALEENAGRDS